MKRCPNLAVCALAHPAPPCFVLYPAVDVVGFFGFASLFRSLSFYAFTDCTFPYHMVLQMYTSDEGIQLRGHCTFVTSNPSIGRLHSL